METLSDLFEGLPDMLKQRDDLIWGNLYRSSMLCRQVLKLRAGQSNSTKELQKAAKAAWEKLSEQKKLLGACNRHSSPYDKPIRMFTYSIYRQDGTCGTVTAQGAKVPPSAYIADGLHVSADGRYNSLRLVATSETSLSVIMDDRRVSIAKGRARLLFLRDQVFLPNGNSLTIDEIVREENELELQHRATGPEQTQARLSHACKSGNMFIDAAFLTLFSEPKAVYF